MREIRRERNFSTEKAVRQNLVCVCVCVCERERRRKGDRERMKQI